MKTFKYFLWIVSMLFGYQSLAQKNEVKVYHPYSSTGTNDDVITLVRLFEKIEQIPNEAELDRIDKMIQYFRSNPESTEWYRYMRNIEIPDSLANMYSSFHHPFSIKHKGAHNLADIYFSQEKYQLAADNYQLALQYPCKSCGGWSSDIQDRIKIQEMLSVCYHYLGRRDSVLTTVLPAFFTNMNENYGKTLAKVTCGYIQQYSKISQVKESIDKGLKNISHTKRMSTSADEVNVFSFNYNEIRVEVEMYGISDKNDFRKAVNESVFYQGLISNCESCSIY